MKKSIAILCIGLLLSLPLVIFNLLNSQDGSRWLIQRVLAWMPAETSIYQIEGRLLDGIQLSQIHYESADQRIDIEQLTLDWRPGELLKGCLKIVDFNLNGVEVLIKQKRPSKPNNFDWNADDMLPIQLQLDHLSIQHLHYQDGENSPFELKQLMVSALTESNQLILKSFDIEAMTLHANGYGKIRLGRQFPFSLSSQWRLDTAEYGQWQAKTQLQGDANQIIIDHQQALPFALALNGQVNNLKTKPEIQLRGDWQKLSWPLSASPPQVSSAQGSFEIKGPLDDYQLSLNGPLTQNYLPNAHLIFKGKGSSTALNIEALQIASDVGGLNINGLVDWKSDTTFALDISGKQFNPAIFLPDLPGKLTFDSHLNGQLSDPNPQIQFTLNTLSGQLRGNPVDAVGKLAIANQTYAVDHLTIRSGRNHISANGILSAAQSNLTIDVDTPVLADFWPGLSGKLKATGNLQGNWQNPSILFQAKGQQLQYQTQKIEQLAIDVDFQTSRKNLSKLLLNASNIKTGDATIASITLNGSGTLPQHQFTLDLKSPLANVSSQLSGSINEQNWQGSLDKLNLDNSDWGIWRLQAPSKIQAIKQSNGSDLQLSSLCLMQKNSSLCLHGQYQANSDFDLQFKAAGLPTALFQTFLPKPMHLMGLIDAEADFQQQKGTLYGKYRLQMPTSNVLIKIEQNNRELALGPMNVLGQLKNNLLSCDADIGLTHSDYLRAKLQFNTKATNALSGQINASIANWDLIRPFIPKANELRGQLTANLNLQGSYSTPQITGQVDLNNAAIEMAETGVGLRQINLQAQATTGKTNRIQITGTVEPVLTPNPNASQQMQFNGRLALSADLEQINSQLRGHYQLEMPTNSSLSFKNAQNKIEVAFAPSSLSGDINGKQINANLALSMLNQDFLRAKLQVDTGESGNLSGQINASLLDLTIFNALLPDISDIKGQLKADLSIQGTTTQPVAQGSLQLLEGAGNIAELGIALQDINLEVASSVLKDEHLQLSGKVKSGEGQLNIHGLLHLNGDADITIQGIDFEVAKLPEAQVSISPDLKLTVTESGVKASGQLNIPKAIIVMDDLPRNAVKVSEDETILGETEQTQKAVKDLGWETNIDVALGKQVSFSGQGLNTELTGRLKIGKTEDKTSLHGTIDMKNGRYKSYGQDLTVRKGRFMFDGPVDAPWLDVEAIRVSKEQDITAILSLSGPLKSPKTRIYSEPALPEAEALAYLMTGSALNQVSKADGSMVAGAALSYGVGKLSWLTEKLGVDEFEVKQGKTLEDTLLTMGEYLTEDFYIGTKIGIFDKQAMLVLRHNLTKNFKIETQAGTSQRVKLSYEVDTD